MLFFQGCLSWVCLANTCITIWNSFLSLSLVSSVSCSCVTLAMCLFSHFHVLLGALIGALFNYLNLALTQWRRIQVQTVRRKLTEVAVVTLITCLLTFIVSYFWTCSSEKSFHTITGSPPVELTQMYCPKVFNFVS